MAAQTLTNISVMAPGINEESALAFMSIEKWRETLSPVNKKWFASLSDENQKSVATYWILMNYNLCIFNIDFKIGPFWKNPKKNINIDFHDAILEFGQAIDTYGESIAVLNQSPDKIELDDIDTDEILDSQFTGPLQLYNYSRIYPK